MAMKLRPTADAQSCKRITRQRQVDTNSTSITTYSTTRCVSIFHIFNIQLQVAYYKDLKWKGYAEKIRDDYNYRGILLLRNPIDVAITFRHFLDGGQTGTAHPVAFRGSSWDEFLEAVATSWADHAIRWIEGIRNGTVIFYEMLQREPETELNRLLRAIHFPAASNERMRCTIAHRNRTDRRRMNKTWLE